jgi:hypothetical protein
VDADRVRGGGVTVTLDDNSTTTASFVTAPMRRINPFTGAGLVNADAAVRAVSDHDEDADHEGEGERHDRDRDKGTDEAQLRD